MNNVNLIEEWRDIKGKEVGCDQSLISHYYKKIKNGEDLYEFN